MVETAIEPNQLGVTGNVQGGELILTAIQVLDIEEISQSFQRGDTLPLEIDGFDDRCFLHRHFPVLVRIEVVAAIGHKRVIIHLRANIVHLLEGIFRACGQDSKGKKKEENCVFHFF